MQPYNLKQNEKLIMQSTVKRFGEVLNIVTIYKDEAEYIRVHNANGAKQTICPFCRYHEFGFYCEKYKQHQMSSFGYWGNDHSLNCWTTTHRNCNEISGNPNEFKDCKWYNTIMIKGIGLIPCRNTGTGETGLCDTELGMFYSMDKVANALLLNYRKDKE